MNEINRALDVAPQKGFPSKGKPFGFGAKSQMTDVASLKNFVSGIAFLDGVWYYITRLIEVMR